jgi:hypothetical protein
MPIETCLDKVPPRYAVSFKLCTDACFAYCPNHDQDEAAQTATAHLRRSDGSCFAREDVPPRTQMVRSRH